MGKKVNSTIRSGFRILCGFGLLLLSSSGYIWGEVEGFWAITLFLCGGALILHELFD